MSKCTIISRILENLPTCLFCSLHQCACSNFRTPNERFEPLIKRSEAAGWSLERPARSHCLQKPCHVTSHQTRDTGVVVRHTPSPSTAFDSSPAAPGPSRKGRTKDACGSLCPCLPRSKLSATAAAFAEGFHFHQEGTRQTCVSANWPRSGCTCAWACPWTWLATLGL